MCSRLSRSSARSLSLPTFCLLAASPRLSSGDALAALTSDMFRLQGEQTDVADKLEHGSRWQRARAWYEGEEAMLRREAAIGEAMQLQAAQRKAGAAVRDRALQRDAVLRSAAMQQQHSASIGHDNGDYSADAPIDPVALRRGALPSLPRVARCTAARPCSHIGE